MKRIVWADALKGILIVLVVLGHSIQASMIKLGGSFINDYLWNLIYSFHMPAFIAVSGYVTFRKNVMGGYKCLAFSHMEKISATDGSIPALVNSLTVCKS